MALKFLQGVARPLRNITFIVLVFFVAPVFALPVMGIYNAQVAIEDQSERQVLNAQKMGFSKVLIKATGQADSVKNPVIRAALKNAQSYVQQFSFTTKLNKGKSQAVIELAFDKLKVNQLVIDAGLPIWGAERAAVLVWLVEDTKGFRQIINDVDHKVVAQIRTQADDRGMPILWPLLDIDDQLAIQVGDLWGLFAEPIKSASNRYKADAILVGRIFQDTQGLWQARWSFWLDDIEQQWSSQTFELDALADSVSDRLTSGLVAKFALSTSVKNLDDTALETVILKVDEVVQFEDYVELREMLQGLSGIQRVQLYSASGRTLEFKLYTQSNLAKIKSIVDLKRRLKLVGRSDGDQSMDVQEGDSRLIWHYQWR